ncbi:hypothetical protein F6Y05_35570 [Bacillus megaterium]|nr:hypothetical protein [Priestia megaterium]
MEMESYLYLKDEKVKKVQYKDSYAHLIKKFPSANSNMDSYIIDNALNDKAEGKAVTFLFVNEKEDLLYGYYSRFATSINYSDDESGEFLGISSVEIKCFAINETYSGKLCEVSPSGRKLNYSDRLLMEVLMDIKYLANNYMGIEAIVLRSTERAFNFYTRNEFEPLWGTLDLPYDEFSKDCIKMYLPLAE